MLDEACAAIDKAGTIEDVWSLGLHTLAEEGVSIVIYLSSDAERRDVRVLSTLPVPEVYERVPPHRDPFLDHCCSSYEIHRTGAVFLNEYPQLTEAERAFIRGARRHGFVSGLGIPTRLQGSPRYGGFNLGTAMERAEFEAAILPRREQFRLFCLVLHRRMEELGFDAETGADAQARPAPPNIGLAAPQSAATALLSPREREVLWLQVQGLPRKEVARICRISPHTVAEYTAKAYRKLGVHNRMEAARLMLPG